MSRSTFSGLTDLLCSRRFAPLFWCQFFSAFNDNFVRNMLAMLILFRLGEREAGVFITLAIGIFMLPSLLLSGLGGEMADAQDKGRLARALKFSEILVQAIAAIGLWQASLPLLYAALFGLGVIGALFWPAEIWHPSPICSKAENSSPAMRWSRPRPSSPFFWGLIAGGLSAAGRTPEGTMLQPHANRPCVLGCDVCLYPPRNAPPLTCGSTPNIFGSTAVLLREIRRDRQLWSRSLAVSWFWMVGAGGPFTHPGRHSQQDRRRSWRRDRDQRALRPWHWDWLARGGP